MKRLLLAFLILCAIPSFADQRAQGFCMVGGQKSVTQGLQSTNDIMASYPQCQVNVYLAGTTTPATLFSDNGVTPLTNPFTANTDASWGFYAADGNYDIVLSGGQAGGFPVPFVISNYFLNSGGGGGGGGCINPGTTGQIPYYSSDSCVSSDPFFSDNAPLTPNGNLVYTGNGTDFTASAGGSYKYLTTGTGTATGESEFQVTTQETGTSPSPADIAFSTDDSGGNEAGANFTVTTQSNGSASSNINFTAEDESGSGGTESGNINLRAQGQGSLAGNISLAAEGTQANSGDLELSATNSGAPETDGKIETFSDGATSLFATGPFSFFGSNASLDSDGNLTVASCTGCGGVTNLAFSSITAGTNAGQALLIGAGSTLDYTAGGTINASSIAGIAGSGTPSAGQVFTATSSSTADWEAIGGITAVNGNPGTLQINFSSGAGSCSFSGGLTTCSVTGSSSGGGSVTDFVASSGAWPTWLTPSVATATTTPTLSVSASAIPNAALANDSITINGVSCVLGASCTAAAPEFQTNGSDNSSQALLNFVNPSTFNGLSFAWSNTSGGIETFGITGTLGNAGLANPSITLGSTSVALGATVSSITGLSITGTAGGLTGSPAITVSSLTDSSLTVGNCVQASTGGLLVTTGTPCGSGSGGTGMTALTGDVNASGTGSVVSVVRGINSVLFSTLATGILKNTNGSGIPSIALPNTDYLTPTGSGSGLTALNASNLGSGTVPAARMPLPTASTLGGIQSKAALTHQWINSISTSGVPATAQPNFSDLLGTAATAQLPLGSSSNPGILQCGSGTSCTGGVISSTGGGGISGLTTGTLPRAASSSTLGNSFIDETSTANTDTFNGANGIAIKGTGPTLITMGGGSVSLGLGSGVSSVTCTSGTCQTARGSVSIVGGTATTGTLVTVTFPITLTGSPVCGVSVNGQATYLGIGHGAPNTGGFTITSAVSVAGKTVAVDYWCEG